MPRETLSYVNYLQNKIQDQGKALHIYCNYNNLHHKVSNSWSVPLIEKLSENDIVAGAEAVARRFCIKKIAWNFVKKETLAQEFSCEFCEIFKNTYFYRTPWVATSVGGKYRERPVNLSKKYKVYLLRQ